MRLRKMKLAGFKSFVDPTTVLMPSELIGVVGPNGCGKSNIIDAVRWVMGESSAKQLRGDNMSDVIFSGSNTRKPVGQASVELVFDNSDGTVAGQFANYNEISVKRQVSRDGQSVYYLNGTRCRRRDITDLFLGTGLGPRSYAIIEQGTISRIIEAKPEELRVFIEEAAGISKYKERRRETETRIRHTRDNLDRLNDLREELEKQLQHLHRQAKAAEKYKILKEEQRLLNAQLLTLRWQGLNGHSEEIESKIRDKETELEAVIAEQRSIEANIEKQRTEVTDANEKLNEIQSRFYAVGGDIGRLEQSIKHTKERRQQQQADLQQLEKDLSSAKEHLDTDEKRIVELKGELEQITPSLEQTREAEKTATSALHSAEEAKKTWQSEWEEFTQKAEEPARAVEVEGAKIQHLKKVAEQLDSRIQKAQTELEEQRIPQLEEEIADLQQQSKSHDAQLAEDQSVLQSTQQDIVQTRETLQSVAQQYDAANESLQEFRGRHASLFALQQAALGKKQEGVQNWLQEHDLNDAQRLAEVLEVQNGWEQAVECVLGGYLEAVCVDNMDVLFNHIKTFSKGQLTLLENNPANKGAAISQTKAALLRSQISSEHALPSYVDNVYVVESLNDAIALRPRLTHGESVVTKEGIWLGVDWMRVAKFEEAHSGVLQREQELKQISQHMNEQTVVIQELQETRSNSHESLKQLEQKRDQLQEQLQTMNQTHTTLHSNLSVLEARYEQKKTRIEKLNVETSEIGTQIASNQEELAQSQQRQQQAQSLIGGHEKRREELVAQNGELQDALEQARSSAEMAREAAHTVSMRGETLRTELNSLQNALERINSQQERLVSRREELSSSLNESEGPLKQYSEELELLLKQRVEVESELTLARDSLQEHDNEIRKFEKQRSETEEKVQGARSGLEDVRISWQETKVRRQTLKENVVATGFTIEAVLHDLPEGANENAWQEEMEKMERRISRLGAINLAAIEEFEQGTERKQYLDSQNADLVEALTTLEDAISKIDKETRTKFKETFDKVNAGLKDLFPRLFGGGHAYLEMTDSDILETGISVMARPPGKRNSTIHLLSGGEKALTAIAMVFSIFELNPAPFCMLDEVDAPLDDANVTRYCDMLKHMSDRIQLIFITHNKVTMEVAKHLTGVTMHEAGVSRLVAVDVDEAVKLVG